MDKFIRDTHELRRNANQGGGYSCQSTKSAENLVQTGDAWRCLVGNGSQIILGKGS